VSEALVLLVVVGTLEAIVYQNRYRATHGTPWAAGLWTFAVCVLRVMFVGSLSVAFKETRPIVACVAYGVPAACVTGAVRGREKKKEQRREQVEAE
jgi:peptidoglycan/LPS O-acetylase OafA/YrhL